jgi:hypothetical protein
MTREPMTHTDLPRHVCETLSDPENADTAGLLRSASAYLDAAKAGDPELLSLSRTLAHAALDHAFLQNNDTLAALRLAARSFDMASRALPRHLRT